jgi:glycosyltransferase involved in cell wall biosynthesis
MQAGVLRRAQLVVATTRRSTARLAEKCRAVGSGARATCIYNGYDAEDFAGTATEGVQREGYRLVYLGTLWALTDAAPLVAGVSRLAAESPALAKGLEVVVAGRRTPEQTAVLRGLDALPCRVRLVDYVEHGEAVRMMREASGLLLLLSGVPSAERIVPAKLFEYMAARRPIVAVVPEGECRELLRAHPVASIADPADPAAVAAALARELERPRESGEVGWGGFDPSPWSRASLAADLAQALDGVVADWREGRP